MYFITILTVGLAVGALGKWLLPGRHDYSVWMTVGLGLLGAMIGGVIGRAFGYYRVTIDPPGIIASAMGAMLVLAGYHSMARFRPANRA